ncbi:redoxin family protein [Bremerella cremea]|uniref:redoxin family protein n=1 Tax=Bremerella cremea TaxID=1031537 RepID=UPI0013142D73|nr:redoxin family protein [Bremerella cremea]
MTINLRVVDEGGQPIADAQAVVAKWTSNLEPMGDYQASDKNGQAELAFPYSDNYFYLIIQRESMAPTSVYLHLDRKTTFKDIEVTLRTAAQSFVTLTANGQPVVDAEFSSLEFTENNGERVVWRKEMARVMGIPWPQSDATGKLPFPPVPQDAIVDFKVIHPKYQQIRQEGIRARAGAIAAIELFPGVPVVVDLQMPSKPETHLPNGTRVYVQMLSPESSRGTETISHPFLVSDGKLTFTANRVSYNVLKITTDKFFVSPTFYHLADIPNPKLDLRNASDLSLQVNLLPKLKARGRVVGPDGNGIKGITVYANFPNTDPSQKTANSANEEAPLPDLSPGTWTSASYGQTDAEGYYELEAPAGPVCVEAIGQGHFSDPHAIRFAWSGNHYDVFPNYVMYRIPKIRGKVIDQAGNPCPGILTRIRHEGRGDADPVAFTNEKGEFELKLSRIPYSTQGSHLETNLSVLAFDPSSNQAGLAQFNVKDEVLSKSLVVQLADKPAGWVLDPFPAAQSQEIDPLVIEEIETNKKKYAPGLPGNSVPEMQDGTWLNTDAKSLEDFRGKYVLLDFWFIGCGPCERDLPSVHAAHQAYQNLGFTVVSMHISGQPVEAVREYAEKHGMDYPIFVDGAKETVTHAFRELGVEGFPMYILLDPAGKIIHNDMMSVDHSLRMEKLELIHEAIHSGRESANAMQ